MYLGILVTAYTCLGVGTMTVQAGVCKITIIIISSLLSLWRSNRNHLGLALKKIHFSYQHFRNVLMNTSVTFQFWTLVIQAKKPNG